MKTIKMVLALVLVLALFSGAACAKQTSPTPEPTVVVKQSFEIDYGKIAGDTAQAKMESLTALLNKKTAGFVKVFSYSKEFEDESGKGTLYSYTLMVYGDTPDQAAAENYQNDIFMIVKQLMAYTAKFVAGPSDNSVARSLVVIPGEYYLFYASQTGMSELRLSPTESWMRSVETIEMELVSSEWLEWVLAYIPSQGETPNQ